MAVANVCLVRVWVDLLAYDPWVKARDYTPPPPHYYSGGLLLVAGLGVALWLLFRSPRVPRTVRLLLGIGLFLLAAKESVVAAAGLGLLWPTATTDIGLPYVVAFFVLAIGAALWAAKRAPDLLARSSRVVSSAAIPFLALTLVQSLVWAARPARAGLAATTASPVDPTPARRRVAWIIFDELDERIAFSQRRGTFTLPAFDRFRREAQFVAAQASSPANATFVSIPLLMNGGKTGDSVFQRAKAQGLRTAAIGWAVPYCSSFGAVDHCAWWPIPQQSNSYGSNTLGAAGGMFRSLFESNHISLFGQSAAVEHYAQVVEDMRVAAEKALARPDLDFVYIHMPPPHNPYLYTPKTGQMDGIPRVVGPVTGYYNNMALADRLFAGMRQAMERTGVWDRTIVLITADHGLRRAVPLGYPPLDTHVPFMVKTPVPVDMDPAVPFNTTITGDLLLRLIKF